VVGHFVYLLKNCNEVHLSILEDMAKVINHLVAIEIAEDEELIGGIEKVISLLIPT